MEFILSAVSITMSLSQNLFQRPVSIRPSIYSINNPIVTHKLRSYATPAVQPVIVDLGLAGPGTTLDPIRNFRFESDDEQ